MELTKMNGFSELNEQEMLMVDGGWDGLMWLKGCGQVIAGGACGTAGAIATVSTGNLYFAGVGFTAAGMLLKEGTSTIENSFYR